MYDRIDSSKRQIRLVELFPSLSAKSKIEFRLCTACLLPATVAEIEEVQANGEVRAFGPIKPVLVARIAGPDGSYESGQVLPYEALSYTWGTSQKGRTVCYRSGRNGRTTVPVTDNLFKALRGLRPRRGKPRIIWIDALCINQADLQERSAQVRFMPDVYRWAEVVNVWLGDPMSINTFIKALHVAAWGLRDASHTPHKFPEQQRDRLGLGRLRQWTLRHLFVSALESTQPAWTGRAWCVQEYVVASRTRLTFGRASLNRPVWSLASYSADGIPVSWKHCEEVIALELHLDFLAGLVDQQRWSSGCSLDDETVISIIDKTDCSDPRDKLYAVLGLLRKDQLDSISVDYASPVWKVFARATYSTVRSSGTLSVLQLCKQPWAGPDSAIPSLPSWAANLTRQPTDSRTQKKLNTPGALDLQVEDLLHLNFAFSPAVTLSDSSDEQWCSISQDFQHLRLRCSRLAVLSHLVPFEVDTYMGATSIYGLDITPWQSLRDSISTDDQESMQTHTDTNIKAVIELPPIASLQEAISQLQHRTLDGFAGRGPDNTVHPSFAATWTDGNPSRYYFGYLNYAVRSSGGALAFVTDNNYLGWAPKGAQPGDCLAMVPNCTLQIVIRRDYSGEYWRFVGFAYLHHLTIGVSEEQEDLSRIAYLRRHWQTTAEEGEDVWLR
ncbi:hypothetical protein CKM354_000999000 [Cercospora kikuchii]|uniref:Heterokaryon incompatibility domain-containing protein n=1 Tax=Cercospora kikuchii TaxID=84275 RepID=A0A9P3CLV3_9PEZI|nr:uncharacterized protein CKM354_000999000 [Cercospora kikuchii]GIZ46884.1 hypothetical protein CKM354_000999000 [Cercospora kikuchii]